MVTGKSSQGDENGSQDNLSSCSESHDGEDGVVINLKGTVTTEEGSTPIRLQLRGYFARLLASKKKGNTKSTDKREVKPSFYGEALTTDEVFERLEKEEKEKEEKKLALASKQRKKEKKRKQTQVTRLRKRSTKKSTLSSGRKRSAKNKKEEESTVEGSENSDNDTSVCEECGTIFSNDTQEGKEKWMGCDNCPRWYHYDCLGLTSIPSGFWSCDMCEMTEIESN